MTSALGSFEVMVAVLLVIICGSLAYIAWILKRVFMPTRSQRIRMLVDRTQFNLKLLEEDGRETLSRFAYSEAGVAVHFQDLADVQEMDANAKQVAKELGRWQRFKGWLHENTDLLVGKVNDVAKSAIGLGGKGKA